MKYKKEKEKVNQLQSLQYDSNREGCIQFNSIPFLISNELKKIDNLPIYFDVTQAKTQRKYKYILQIHTLYNGWWLNSQ